MTTVSKAVWHRYITSPKGVAMLAAYTKSDKRKESIKRYQTSDKAKANRKAKPEIYRVGIENMLTNNVCGILQEHAEKVKGDPESLSIEYICTMARIKIEPKIL